MRIGSCGCNKEYGDAELLDRLNVQTPSSSLAFTAPCSLPGYSIFVYYGTSPPDPQVHYLASRACFSAEQHGTDFARVMAMKSAALDV